MLIMYAMSMTITVADPKPWVAWPAIAKAARVNGWRVLAERGGVARMERRDPRSESGAVTLHVEFNRAGHIAGAWIEELDRNIRRQPKKLNTILQWISEAVPVKHYDAGRCANCRERIELTIGTGFQVYVHPDHGNHTVCDWEPGMQPTDRVATPMSGFDTLNEAIAERTGGKLLGEMATDELRAAFSSGPIHIRHGEVVA